MRPCPLFVFAFNPIFFILPQKKYLQINLSQSRKWFWYCNKQTLKVVQQNIHPLLPVSMKLVSNLCRWGGIWCSEFDSVNFVARLMMFLLFKDANCPDTVYRWYTSPVKKKSCAHFCRQMGRTAIHQLQQFDDGVSTAQNSNEQHLKILSKSVNELFLVSDFRWNQNKQGQQNPDYI